MRNKSCKFNSSVTPLRSWSSCTDETAFRICVFVRTEVTFYLDCTRERIYSDSNVIESQQKEAWATTMRYKEMCSWDSGFHCGTLASPSSTLLPTVSGEQREEEVIEPQRDKWKKGGWRGIRACPFFSFLDCLLNCRIHNACEESDIFNRRKTTLDCVLLWLVTKASARFISLNRLNNSFYFASQSDNCVLFTIKHQQTWRLGLYTSCT